MTAFLCHCCLHKYTLRQENDFFFPVGQSITTLYDDEGNMLHEKDDTWIHKVGEKVVSINSPLPQRNIRIVLEVWSEKKKSEAQFSWRLSS